MGWPVPQDYNEAVQNSGTAFADPDLRAAAIESDSMGLPKPRSGNFAVVYKAVAPGKVWAVRCFTREVDGQEQRHREIHAALDRHRFPFTADFRYLSQGVCVRGTWYPVLKMEWLQGDLLHKYVERNLNAPAYLVAAANEVANAVARMSAEGIAHGDLQHGNIVVVNGRVKLIDYDGMFVPGLRGMRSNELGHSDFQHPKRDAADFGPDLDDFSARGIVLTLKALAADPGLWHRHGGGDDRLLFRKADFVEPATSPLLSELSRSPDAEVRQLTGEFRSLAIKTKSPTPPSESVSTGNLIGGWLAKPEQSTAVRLPDTIGGWLTSPSQQPAAPSAGEPNHIQAQVTEGLGPQIEVPYAAIANRPPKSGTAKTVRCAWSGELVPRREAGRCDLTGIRVAKQHLNRYGQLSPLAALLDGKHHLISQDHTIIRLGENSDTLISLRLLDPTFRRATEGWAVRHSPSRPVFAVVVKVGTGGWFRPVEYIGLVLRDGTGSDAGVLGLGIRGRRDHNGDFVGDLFEFARRRL